MTEQEQIEQIWSRNMNKNQQLEFFKDLVNHQTQTMIDQHKTICELNKLLDKASFKQTEFVYINKTAHDNEVSHNLAIEIIDPAKRTYNISKIPLIPLVNINQEQPIVNILSTKSNKNYILIKVEILVKQSRSEKILLHNKQNHTTRFITPQELNLYKE